MITAFQETMIVLITAMKSIAQNHRVCLELVHKFVWRKKLEIMLASMSNILNGFKFKKFCLIFVGNKYLYLKLYNSFILYFQM